MRNLCYTCQKCAFCDKPFPWDECEEYEHRITNYELVKLYWGMSKTMQKAVYEIMKTVQGREDACEAKEDFTAASAGSTETEGK